MNSGEKRKNGQEWRTFKMLKKSDRRRIEKNSKIDHHFRSTYLADQLIMTGQMRTTLDAGIGSIAVLQVLLEQCFTHFARFAGAVCWYDLRVFAGDAGIFEMLEQAIQ